MPDDKSHAIPLMRSDTGVVDAAPKWVPGRPGSFLSELRPNMRFLRHIAEAAAALLLRLKGHRIVARKFNTPAGPIDFVTLQDNRLAFVETKRHQVADHSISA